MKIIINSQFRKTILNNYKSKIILVFFVFFSGIYFEKKFDFTYLILNFVKIDKNIVNNNIIRKVESALLPLTLREIDLTEKFKKIGGGLCAINEKIFISDRIGKIFRFDTDKLSLDEINTPRLNNFYEDFLKSPMSINDMNFRVHNLKCFESQNILYFLLSHEVFDKDDSNTTHLAVSELKVEKESLLILSDWQLIFWSEKIHHPTNSFAGQSAGGAIAIDSSLNIFLTFGDYGLDKNYRSISDPRLGSILYIDRVSKEVRVISRGHRNPQGIIIDDKGELISSEQGPKGGDEINRIKTGNDYGWPYVSYGTGYETYDITNLSAGRHDGYEKPIFAFVPSPAIDSIIQINNFNERWKGDFLVSSLKAGTLFRLRYDDGIIRYSEPIWIGPRLRDLIEVTNGKIAILTDNGTLILLEVDNISFINDSRSREIEKTSNNLNCMLCHHVGQTNATHLAPTLSKILNKKIAADNYSNYSTGLKNIDGRWTEENLRKFLNSPANFAPGTNMIIETLSKKEIDDAIYYIKTLD